MHADERRFEKRSAPVICRKYLFLQKHFYGHFTKKVFKNSARSWLTINSNFVLHLQPNFTL